MGLLGVPGLLGSPGGAHDGRSRLGDTIVTINIIVTIPIIITYIITIIDYYCYFYYY